LLMRLAATLLAIQWLPILWWLLLTRINLLDFDARTRPITWHFHGLTGRNRLTGAVAAFIATIELHHQYAILQGGL